MVPARHVAVLAVVIAVVVGALTLVGLDHSSPSGEVSAPTLLEISARSVASTTVDPALSLFVDATTPSTASTSTTTIDVPMGTDLVVLVEQRRPLLATTEIVDDGARFASEPSDVDLAARVVSALWSWRFDDLAGRLGIELAGLASADAVGVLQPDGDEVQRRRVSREVSSVIITETAGHTGHVLVHFDQQLVTSDTVLVVRRTVAVTVIDGVVVKVVEVAP